MNKEEIRRLALLAAAKVTLLVGPAGCHDEAARPGPRAPFAQNAAPDDAAPHTACALPAETVVVTPPPPPAATVPPSVATVPPVAAVVETPPAAAPSPAAPARKLSAAQCDAVLTAADRNDKAAMKDVPWNTAWECCRQPGAVSKHNFCTPWGPPAPPEMPTRDAALWEVA